MFILSHGENEVTVSISLNGQLKNGFAGAKPDKAVTFAYLFVFDLPIKNTA